jgi:hypothetical protein
MPLILFEFLFSLELLVKPADLNRTPCDNCSKPWLRLLLPERSSETLSSYDLKDAVENDAWSLPFVEDGLTPAVYSCLAGARDSLRCFKSPPRLLPART